MILQPSPRLPKSFEPAHTAMGPAALCVLALGLALGCSSDNKDGEGTSLTGAQGGAPAGTAGNAAGGSSESPTAGSSGASNGAGAGGQDATAGGTGGGGGSTGPAMGGSGGTGENTGGSAGTAAGGAAGAGGDAGGAGGQAAGGAAGASGEGGSGGEGDTEPPKDCSAFVALTVSSGLATPVDGAWRPGSQIEISASLANVLGGQINEPVGIWVTPFNDLVTPVEKPEGKAPKPNSGSDMAPSLGAGGGRRHSVLFESDPSIEPGTEVIFIIERGDASGKCIGGLKADATVAVD